MLKLYGQPPTRVLRALWVLNFLGLEYEEQEVDLLSNARLAPEFRKLNPAARVPVLVDGDTVVTESVAIQLYLAEKHPEGGLIPDTLELRSQMYRWLFFVVTEIEAPLWRIARNTQGYPEAERQPSDIVLATRECKEMLQVLEDHMRGRQFLVGERISVADMNAAYMLDWASEVGMLNDFPELQAYYQRMYSRPEAPITIARALASMGAQ